MSHTRTAPDLMQTVNDLGTGWADAMQQWWDQSQEAFAPWLQPRSGARRHEGCGDDPCEGCGDPCACCVPDADVVVHAVAGEVRVVSFELRNHWRRERRVTVAAGPWQMCGGADLDVRSVLHGEEVVLEACETRVVRLAISVRGKDDSENRQVADVDSCASAYSDIRFEGCGRPQRVAVVVHPANCDAIDVPCDCGCC